MKFAVAVATAAATAATLLDTAHAGYKEPVVLMHGLGGWHEGEFFGFPYWSYAGEFSDAGLDVIVTDVGKFTSNWDRACEFFAQLRGTVTDYGVCHSAEAGHARFGKNFTGQAKFPQWNADNRIHLVTHSMGCQTALVLETLLQHGSGCAEDTSELFTGQGRDWLASITTFDGTCDGTTFVDIMGDNIGGVVRDLVVALAGLIDNSPIEDVYAIDFSQWGVVENPGENFIDFWNRAEASGLLSPENHDISLYELSSVGAREINNQRQQAYPNTYYFAIASERTNTVRDCFLFICGDPYEVPDPLMIIFLDLSASLMGAKSQPREKQENDGLVPQWSQICPTNDHSSKSDCIEYSGTWTPGKWYYHKIHTLDHLQIILPNTLTDIFDYDAGPKKQYHEQALRIRAISTPTTAAAAALIASDDAVTTDFQSIQYLKTAQAQPADPMVKVAPIVVLVVASVAAAGLIFAAVRRVYHKGKEEGVAEERAASIAARSQISVDHYVSDARDVETAVTRDDGESTFMQAIHKSLRKASKHLSTENESTLMDSIRKSIRMSKNPSFVDILEEPVSPQDV